MKKAQWQFTHRPGNQADIKRILREARADGLTLVEVRGGPRETRGVYIDAEFVQKHKEHWPSTALHPPRPEYDLDGWDGNWVAFAGERKRAHAQFIANLEKASSKPEERQYPPTVSVRAVGPGEAPKAEPAQPYIPKPGEWFTVGPRRIPELPGTCWIEDRDSLLIGKTLRCSHLEADQDVYFTPQIVKTDGGTITFVDTRDFAYLTPAQDPAQGLPKPGEWFKVSGYLPERSVFRPNGHKFDRERDGHTFQCKWVDKPSECDVTADTIKRYGNCIQTTEEGVNFRTKEWERIEIVEAPAPYIPKVGDRFTAAVKPGAETVGLSDVQLNPHKQVFVCVWNDGDDYVGVRREDCGDVIKRPAFNITASAYEFKKVEPQPEKPYIPKVGDWFSAKAISGGALTQIKDDPHGQTLICVDDFGSSLGIKFFGGESSGVWTITKAFYEFRKREKL